MHSSSFVRLCVWACASTLIWSHRRCKHPAFWDMFLGGDVSDASNSSSSKGSRSSRPWYEALQNFGTVEQVLEKQNNRYGFKWNEYVTNTFATKRPWARGAKTSQILSLADRKLRQKNSSCIRDGSAFDEYEQAIAIAVYTGNTVDTSAYAHSVQIYASMNHDLRQLHRDDYSSEREHNFRDMRVAYAREQHNAVPSDDSCSVDVSQTGLQCFLDRWGGYLYWMFRGFQHVAQSKHRQHTILYRAISYPEKQRFVREQEFTWHSFSSTSRSPFIPLSRFTSTGGTSVLFIIMDADGVEVSSFSAFPVEGETLILPGARMRVLDFYDWSDQDASYYRTSTLDDFKKIPQSYVMQKEVELAATRKVSICWVVMMVALDIGALQLPPPDSSCPTGAKPAVHADSDKSR
eukprot:TRINITY_DN14539_c0_g1_i1.p1 TRINITY_DN14539_c0_g1~~TRINITY_DN14539_c0_g1_i1.p1  ORF type:complete len:405 (-),score=28.99 TRINITY_DN14539_c0_g1_i1:38-1252(-)